MTWPATVHWHGVPCADLYFVAEEDTYATPSLPQNGKRFALTTPAITVGRGEIVVFAKEEIASLLAAPDCTKLYILLMLNCGIPPKDVADLAVAEVNWVEGRIKRKRSRTGDCENVPTVNYKFRAETFRLLRQERAQLLNTNGSPLWTQRMTKNR